MKTKRLFALSASAMALAAAGIIYPAKYYSWFSQSFDGLTDGTSFTGTQGAISGGTWGTIGSGVATVTTAVERKGLALDTFSTASDAIAFSASTTASKDYYTLDFAVLAEPAEWYPAVTDDDKALFCLLSNDGSDMIFGVYLNGTWTQLHGHGLATHTARWLDCRAEFQIVSGNSRKVTFSVRNTSGEYVPLVKTGTTDPQLDLGSSAGYLKTIAFSGLGTFGNFKGQGVERDTSHVCTWNTPSGGSWTDTTKWTDNKVPGDDDVASFTKGSNPEIYYGDYTLIPHNGTASAPVEFTIVENESLHLYKGHLTITRKSGDDYSALGTIIVDPGATLTAQGTYRSMELSVGSTLDLADGNLTLKGGAPLFLDGVYLTLPSDSYLSDEAFTTVTAPYGSGGTPILMAGTSVKSGYSAAWHGQLDGSSVLWIINDRYNDKQAIWNDGAWGNLMTEANWDPIWDESNAALMRYGKAHVNGGDEFRFARRFHVGTQTDESAEISMSGGSVASGSVIVGASEGTGLLDVVGGAVETSDYLWYPALTIGADTQASGTVTIRGGQLTAAEGSVSVGAAGSAQMTLSKGKTIVGGTLAVGYAGSLDVSAGSLVVSNSVFVGRTTRTETYDVTMTVSGGSVSNISEGAGLFWVGSYGGYGSQAILNLTGGEIFTDGPFVVGACRSAAVNVAGGSLVAPSVGIGTALLDTDDAAAFTLSDYGRVETTGFTAGTTGTHALTLADGEVVATAASDDFFTGLDIVRLEGDTTLENEANVTVTSALTGFGGLAKTGAGTLKVAGYAAWGGKTTVTEGTLDMDGGMIMGELEVAEGASVKNAKYDDFSALPFTESAWSSGTTSSKPYLRIAFNMKVGETSEAQAKDSADTLKGAIKRTASGLAGYTALGWIDLLRLTGTEVGAAACDVRMFFDFKEGKPYVVYEIKDGENWERLMSADGLTVFPVLGTLLNVTTFSGVTMTEGKELTVTEGSVLYWIGSNDAAWNDGANWSKTSGGSAAGSIPTSTTTAFIELPRAITLAAGCAVGSLVVNADVQFAGASLTVAADICGIGRLTLTNATLTGTALIDVPVTIDGTSAITAKTLYGALSGSGDVTLATDLNADTSAFEGSATLTSGRFVSALSRDNACSAWTIGGAFPFATDNATYTFGALNGTINATATDPSAITLSVGARDENCTLTGGWPTTSESTLAWTAPSATLTCSVENLGTLYLSGGGTVTVNADAGIPSAVSFVENGGTLTLGTAVTTDLSTVIKNSTGVIGYDDNGSDHTWAEALASSNVGRFVKRGSGTLTWTQAPANMIDVTVEEGTLRVPFGTRLGAVRIADGACLILDMNGGSVGTALAIDSSDRALAEPRFAIENPVAGYKTATNARNGIVIYCGSETFIWVGGETGDWSELANWRVNGDEPTRLPAEQDDVQFNEAATVVLESDVRVRAITAAADLTVTGANLTLDASLAMLNAGRLTLDHVDLAAAEAQLATLAGTGTVRTTCGTLTLTSDPDNDSHFVGTLDVTNLVLYGEGSFEYTPLTTFDGVLAINQGRLKFSGEDNMTNQPTMHVTMRAGAALELCDHAVNVASFVGAGIIETNGWLVTADHTITQQGGELSLAAVAQTTYVASHVGEVLRIENAAGITTKIVIPRSWFKAGVSGRHAVFCENPEVVWDVQRTNAQKPVYEGDGWWSIPGGGFTIRLK